MKAVQLTSTGELRLIETQEPTLSRSDEIMLRMHAVGICGSDLHYFKEGGIGGRAIEQAWIVGHEGAGTVAQVGGEVSRFKPGDRVVFDPNISCGTCDQCKNGRHHTCLNGRFLGCPGQLQGCLAELVVLPESCCVSIGNSLDLNAAVLAEPLSVALHSLRFLHDIEDTDVGVLGAGPIGLCTLMALDSLAAKSISVTDKIAHRRESAAKWGATRTWNPDDPDIVAQILDNHPHGLNAVFECCGDQSALDQAVDLLKPGGTLIITGIPSTERVSFDISKLRRKEISVQNVRRQNNCLDEAVQWVSENLFNIHDMITHTFSLNEAQQAFELAGRYGDGVLKAVVNVAWTPRIAR